MAVISQTIFSDEFSWMKSILVNFSQKFVPKGLIDYNPVPNRWQAIIWSNADMIHWRIYAALGGVELNLYVLNLF